MTYNKEDNQVEYSESVLDEVLPHSPLMNKRRRTMCGLRKSSLGGAARVKTSKSNPLSCTKNVANSNIETRLKSNKENDHINSFNNESNNEKNNSIDASSSTSGSNIIANDQYEHIEEKSENNHAQIETQCYDSNARLTEVKENSNDSTRSRSDSQSNDRVWHLQDFIMGKPLGRGKFGNVYLAKQKSTHVPVALKVLFKQTIISAKSVNLLRREVEIQSRLRHKNITRLCGFFHDERNIYLILEFISRGELHKVLQKSNSLCSSTVQTPLKKVMNQFGRVGVSEVICRDYMRDIVSALQYLHSKYVYHRDLKPENILVADDFTLRLADFGWAVHAPPSHRLRYTMCGTPGKNVYAYAPNKDFVHLIFLLFYFYQQII